MGTSVLVTDIWGDFTQFLQCQQEMKRFLPSEIQNQMNKDLTGVLTLPHYTKLRMEVSFPQTKANFIFMTTVLDCNVQRAMYCTEQA